MKRLLFVVLVALALSSCSRVYVLSVKEYPTDFGGSAWVLDYSLDGMIYSGVFDTREEVVKYYAWLKRGKRVRGGIDGE